MATSKSTSTSATSTATKSKKMGLERYIQIKELKSGIAAIMRRRYAKEVHTQEEWDSLLDYVLNRKVG